MVGDNISQSVPVLCLAIFQLEDNTFEKFGGVSVEFEGGF